MFKSIEEIQTAMEEAKYIVGRDTATVLFLSLKLGKPILVEGEAGVGKTEIAKVLAQIQGTRLSASSVTKGWIRLRPCTSGITPNRSSG
jgi:MoxR-like ATPase